MNMRSTILALAVAGLVAPFAAATTEYGSSAPTNMASAPAYYWASNYALTLQAGDVVTATLTYGNSNSDLDMTLTSDFYAPVPIPPTGCAAADPVACQAEASHYVDQRIGRVTCTDTVAASEHHPDGGVETITATIPTSGVHQLAIINYYQVPTTTTPYILTLSVIRGGSDVSGTAFNAAEVSTYTINNYVHCAALGLRNSA